MSDKDDASKDEATIVSWLASSQNSPPKTHTGVNTRPRPESAAHNNPRSLYTQEELEAAEALLLLSRGVTNHGRESKAVQSAITSASALKPSIRKAPALKRVRIQLPSGRTVSSAENVESEVEDPTACLPQSKRRKTTFEEDHTEAINLVGQCAKPLGAFARPATKVDLSMLTFEEHAALATEHRRRATMDPLANTKLAHNPHKNTSTKEQQSQTSNMDPFWQGPQPAENIHSAHMSLQSAVQEYPDFPDAGVDQSEINQALFNALEKMHQDVIRTSASNQVLYEHVGMLRERMKTLEQENDELQSRLDEIRTKSRQRQPPKLNLAAVEGDDSKVSTAALTGTTLAFPSRPATGTSSTFQKAPLASDGLSTLDVLAAESSVPKTPATPALIVPTTPNTPGSRTVLYKKDKHDLKGKLPPANVRLPMVPLTDVELIVFFYNSTARPIVAVRLYARGGPNWIAQIINEHREVKPEGYKRNTCSVHCNKSVKAFIRLHGEEWKKKVSEYFESADDEQATETIRHRDHELADTCDFPVLGLFKDLKKLPGEHHRGIFTQCIGWCRDNKVNAKVSQIHLIAEALSEGEDPHARIEFSPAPSDEDIPMTGVDLDKDDVFAPPQLAEKRRSSTPVDSPKALDTEADLSEVSDDESVFSSVPSPVKMKQRKYAKKSAKASGKKSASKSAIKIEDPELARED